MEQSGTLGPHVVGHALRFQNCWIRRPDSNRQLKESKQEQQAETVFRELRTCSNTFVVFCLRIALCKLVAARWICPCKAKASRSLEEAAAAAAVAVLVGYSAQVA
eukprot:1154138-Pelagomonas_calceolata.AAC.1